MVEPRMMIRSDGSLKRLIAVDDRGQSLLPDDLESKQPDHDFGFTPPPMSWRCASQEISSSLAGPSGSSAASHPSWSPHFGLNRCHSFGGAAGRSYKSAESVLTIQTSGRSPRYAGRDRSRQPDGESQKPDRPAQATEIELTLRRADGSGVALSGRDFSEDQFEVVDAQGRVLTSPWWFSDSGPKQQGVEVRVRRNPFDDNFVPWNGPSLAPNCAIRNDRRKVEVPFEFSDLALP